MLSTYDMHDCKTVKTPMDAHGLSTSMAPSTPEEIAFMKTKPYINAVGSLMYLATSTRPDIAYAVGVLCRFNSNPGKAHWSAVQHLFRYLKGTLDYKLTYSPDPSGQLFTSYCDASHGDNPDSGRSTGGYILKIGTGAVSWSSKLQSFVTLSSTEAEFVAAVDAGKEIIWLRQLLEELGFPSTSASILNIDNQSSLSVAKNPELLNSATKGG